MVNSSRIGVPWEYPRDGFSNATHSTSNTSAWAPQAPEFGSRLLENGNQKVRRKFELATTESNWMTSVYVEGIIWQRMTQKELGLELQGRKSMESILYCDPFFKTSD